MGTYVWSVQLGPEGVKTITATSSESFEVPRREKCRKLVGSVGGIFFVVIGQVLFNKMSLYSMKICLCWLNPLLEACGNHHCT
jgi:hypothetical protein